MSSVPDIYRNMEYGPVSDSSSLAESWLKNKTFGAFIDGSWKTSSSSDSYEVKNPCTGQTIASITTTKTEELDTVIKSTMKAQSSWKKLPGYERAKHLYSIARHLQKHTSLLVQMESLNRGVQSKDPRAFDVPAMVRYFYYYAGWAQLQNRKTGSKDIVLGITSAISPLVSLAQIVAPALAAGCSVILKPPRRTPLTAYLLADICNQAGLPPGVLNVIPGSKDVGKLLALSVVEYISFCGLTAVGREIRQETAGRHKSLTLLLSGKTPSIVFDSADLDSAVDGVIEHAWYNQGQVAWAIRIVLVQESIFEEFVKKLKTKTINIGSAFDKMADVGQPVDKAIVTAVNKIVSEAKENGCAEVVTHPVPSSLETSSYFPPTFVIGSQVENNKVVNEDLICPVVSVLPFRTAKEAIALANNTRYGVAASVWTEAAGLALDVANQLQVGTVWINCHGVMDASIPFGGWKQSGLGTYGGREGLLEYLLPKNTSIAMETGDLDYKAFEAGKGTDDVTSADLKDSSVVEVDHTYKLYYGGAHKRPDSNSSRTIKDGNGKPSFTVPEGNKKDIRNAVEVAVAAQQSWWKSGPFLRSQIIYNIAEKLQGCLEDLNRHLESVVPSSSRESASALDILFQWAACCDKKFASSENSIPVPNVTVRTTREPFGVIGIILDDAVPLSSFIAHVAAAISYGNSVIVIPDMSCPTPALELCQVFDTSDVPKGLINVITGDKQLLGSALAQHQEVRALWYCGSDAKMINYLEWASSYNMKHVWVHTDWKKDFIHREVFEVNSSQSKAVWIPYGEIFAN